MVEKIIFSQVAFLNFSVSTFIEPLFVEQLLYDHPCVRHWEYYRGGMCKTHSLELMIQLSLNLESEPGLPLMPLGWTRSITSPVQSQVNCRIQKPCSIHGFLQDWFSMHLAKSSSFP